MMSQFQLPFGDATQVTLATFVDDFMPSLPPGLNFDAFIRRMRMRRRTGKHLITKNDRLWGYGQKLPSQMSSSDAFAHLKTCADRLAAALPRRNRCHRFTQNGSFPPKACTFDSLPHVYFEPCVEGISQDPQWSSVAVSGIFALESTKLAMLAVARNVERCMARCLMEDPRRRFTYAFTIEDTTMRLWYCDRGHFVVTESFDFIVDYATLFRFFLACTFAEPQALGFDPTMTLFGYSGDEPQYDIVVRSRTGEERMYRTLRSLFDGGSDHVAGKGTRVWAALRVDPVSGETTGDPVVLKDSWVGRHREREGDILTRIRQSASSLGEADRLRLEGALVTILQHGDVRIADETDCTRALPHTGIRGFNYILDDDMFADMLGVQVHYRAVYKELCLPLCSEACLASAYAAVADVCETLSLLHRCGWFHGDISSQNILLHDGKVKLSDFECAKKDGEVTEHDRVGTKFFIPVEVQAHAYLFQGRYWGDPKPARKRRRFRRSAPSGDVTGDCTTPQDDSDDFWMEVPPYPGPFRYNPLHDLESLWWISAYLVMSRVLVFEDDAEPRDEKEERYLTQQRAAVRDLFIVGDGRRGAIRTESDFSHMLHCLHPFMRDMALALDDARDALVRGYHFLEKDIDNRMFSVRQETYDEMGKMFTFVAERMKAEDVKTERLNV